MLSTSEVTISQKLYMAEQLELNARDCREQASRLREMALAFRDKADECEVMSVHLRREAREERDRIT